MTVIVATIVRNEADRFLPRALDCWTAVSDRIVAVDNCSTDDTADILQAFGAEVHPFGLPMDGNETAARKFLWDKALAATPDGGWIVHLDADHCVADDFRPHLRGNRVVFPVFDMWDASHFRSDAWWRVRPWWQAVRVTPETRSIAWRWPERGWHSGHVPANSNVFGPALPVPIECGILHYGYATPELRARHAAAYEARARHLSAAELFHARTILDEKPRLVPLGFEPRWSLL